MGEAGFGFGVKPAVRSSLSLEPPCAALLRELESLWTDIGETGEDKDRMFLELEMECTRVYRREVDEASAVRTQLHQSLVAKEAELATLIASLGENSPQLKKDRNQSSLKEQLASVTPLLEDLRSKKEERIKQLLDVRSQIESISAEMTGYDLHHDSSTRPFKEEHDLSVRNLTELQTQLCNLQKEKSDRLKRVLEYVNEVHSLCGVLGPDFTKTVNEVHPSLHQTDSEKSTNISDSTLDGLARTVLKLKTEKKIRLQKLQETVEKLFKLWNSMELPEEERRQFGKVVSFIRCPEEDAVSTGILSPETIKQTEAEVDRLTKLKASRMKEIVLKRRLELEEICRRAHIDPDTSSAPEKCIALIDSGLVDPSELLTQIEGQIVETTEESLARKEIMDGVWKWVAACDEENWLEEYNKDINRYIAGKGAHLNLRRAEKARMIANKMPAMVDNLMSRTFAWEDERNKPFLYDGVRLICLLEECKLSRLQKEEERRRYRDQKKLHNLLVTERELTYRSKPVPRTGSLNRKMNNGHHPNGKGAGFMTPIPQRVSIGSATPELLTPRSYSGHSVGYFNETRRRLSSFKEDSMSSFASISGSERGSSPSH